METALGGELQHGMKMTIVRDVAPNKVMICISFLLPDFCRDAPADEAGRASKRVRSGADAAQAAAAPPHDKQ